jgi:hypothetical protein
MYQLFVGLFTEGTTDDRFLQSIVQRTLEDIAFNEGRGQFEIEVNIINLDKTGKKFVNLVLEASKKGVEEFGMMLFCIHRDADAPSAENTLKNLINPAIKVLEAQEGNDSCKNIVPIVPIQETESWMLADKALLKIQINATQKSNSELGIENSPENIASPKEKIEEAIRISRKNIVKKRRKSLAIKDLYLPIGQALNLADLIQLSSFRQFQEDARIAFRILGLLR